MNYAQEQRIDLALSELGYVRNENTPEEPDPNGRTMFAHQGTAGMISISNNNEEAVREIETLASISLAGNQEAIGRINSVLHPEHVPVPEIERPAQQLSIDDYAETRDLINGITTDFYAGGNGTTADFNDLSGILLTDYLNDETNLIVRTYVNLEDNQIVRRVGYDDPNATDWLPDDQLVSVVQQFDNVQELNTALRDYTADDLTQLEDWIKNNPAIHEVVNENAKSKASERSAVENQNITTEDLIRSWLNDMVQFGSAVNGAEGRETNGDEYYEQIISGHTENIEAQLQRIMDADVAEHGMDAYNVGSDYSRASVLLTRLNAINRQVSLERGEEQPEEIPHEPSSVDTEIRQEQTLRQWAVDLDQFASEYDPNGYDDRVNNSDENIENIIGAVQNGNIAGIQNFLDDVRNTTLDSDETAPNRPSSDYSLAQDLSDRLDDIMVERPDRDKLIEAMEVAGLTYDAVNSENDILIFRDNNGFATTFDSWNNLNEWINGADFGDPQIAANVDAVLHSQNSRTEHEAPQATDEIDHGQVIRELAQNGWVYDPTRSTDTLILFNGEVNGETETAQFDSWEAAHQWYTEVVVPSAARVEEVPTQEAEEVQRPLTETIESPWDEPEQPEKPEWARIYRNRATGEIMNYPMMRASWRNEYDGDDDTNILTPEEVFEEIGDPRQRVIARAEAVADAGNGEPEAALFAWENEQGGMNEIGVVFRGTTKECEDYALQINGGLMNTSQVRQIYLERLREEEGLNADTFAIYQIRDDSPLANRHFESYNNMVRYIHEPAISDYSLVYYQITNENEKTAEDIFDEFQRDDYERPADFMGYTPSISDVIVMHQNGEDRAYYVNPTGFRELPNFMPEKENVMENNISQEAEKALEDVVPTITIGFSENPILGAIPEADKTDMDFAVGNEMLRMLDNANVTREGYDKTDYAVHAVINGKEFNYTGRFDIGDGEGSLVDHIRNSVEYDLSARSQIPLSEEGRRELESILDTFIPAIEEASQITPEARETINKLVGAEELPNRYYYPDLDLDGTADELFVQARNGYIDDPEALRQIQQILNNPFEDDPERAMYVGFIIEEAEAEVSRTGFNLGTFKRDIYDSGLTEETLLEDGSYIQLSRDGFEHTGDTITLSYYGTDGTSNSVQISVTDFYQLTEQDMNNFIGAAIYYAPESEQEVEQAMAREIYVDIDPENKAGRHRRLYFDSVEEGLEEYDKAGRYVEKVMGEYEDSDNIREDTVYHPYIERMTDSNGQLTERITDEGMDEEAVVDHGVNNEPIRHRFEPDHGYYIRIVSEVNPGEGDEWVAFDNMTDAIEAYSNIPPNRDKVMGSQLDYGDGTIEETPLMERTNGIDNATRAGQDIPDIAAYIQQSAAQTARTNAVLNSVAGQYYVRRDPADIYNSHSMERYNTFEEAAQAYSIIPNHIDRDLGIYEIAEDHRSVRGVPLIHSRNGIETITEEGAAYNEIYDLNESRTGVIAWSMGDGSYLTMQPSEQGGFNYQRYNIDHQEIESGNIGIGVIDEAREALLNQIGISGTNSMVIDSDQFLSDVEFVRNYSNIAEKDANTRVNSARTFNIKREDIGATVQLTFAPCQFSEHYDMREGGQPIFIAYADETGRMSQRVVIGDKIPETPEEAYNLMQNGQIAGSATQRDMKGVTFVDGSTPSDYLFEWDESHKPDEREGWKTNWAEKPPYGTVMGKFQSAQGMDEGYLMNIAIIYGKDGYNNHFLYNDIQGTGTMGTGPFNTYIEAKQDVMAHNSDAIEVSKDIIFEQGCEKMYTQPLAEEVVKAKLQNRPDASHNEEEIRKQRHELRRNIACAGAIDNAITINFDGMYLKDGTLDKVIEAYGDERVKSVLANTVQHADWDKRYRPDTREWARKVVIEDNHKTSYLLRSHPEVINGVCGQFRQYEKDKEQQIIKETAKLDPEEAIAMGLVHPQGKVFEETKEEVKEQRTEKAFEQPKEEVKPPVVEAKAEKAEKAVEQPVERPKEEVRLVSTSWEFDGGKAEVRSGNLHVKFNEEPERAVLKAVKRAGFKWDRMDHSWAAVATKETYNNLNNVRAVQPLDGTKPSDHYVEGFWNKNQRVSLNDRLKQNIPTGNMVGELSKTAPVYRNYER